MIQPTKKSLNAWHTFLNRVESAVTKLTAQPTDEIWFRGHSSSDFVLLPSLFRGYDAPNHSPQWERIWDRESDLFWEFSARARELQSHLRSDWDYLFAMQHYRTPTRLLDWTEVLGVAVYFAVLNVDESNPKKQPPPCVWALNPYELNRRSAGVESDDLYAPEILGWDANEHEYYTYSELLVEEGIGFDFPLAIYPRQTKARIHAQRAWFTIHGDEYIPMERCDKSEQFLQKIDIPFESIPAARRFLAHAGIDHYLMFADLENLSKFITEKNHP